MPALSFRRERGLLYVSRRLWVLRLAAFASVVPLAVCLVLLLVAPRAEWERAPFGHVAWWVFPAAITALTLLLPVAMLWLHDRYVTRVVFEPDGRLRVTTFVLWGQRTQRYKSEEVVARRFLLDRSGTAPMGFDTLKALGFRNFANTVILGMKQKRRAADAADMGQRRALAEKIGQPV